MEKVYTFTKKQIIILGITILAFGLRVFYQSPWLEDWDSVQFALALHDYSVVDHQPHPPGYPLYILLGRFLYIFLHNDTKTLTFLSSLLGSLAVIPLYYLAKRMFGKFSAILASLFFVFMPVGWILSEIPINNIPGLFFVLMLACFLYTLVENKKWGLAAGLISGLTLGIRPTDLPVVGGLLGFLILKNFRFKYAFIIVISFLIGIMLWLIPLILITGLEQFLNAYSVVASYGIRHDMLFGKSFYFPEDFIILRLTSVWHLLTTSYTPYFLILSFISMVWIILKKTPWKNPSYQFLLIWLFMYSIPLVFFYNLELPQYTLPLLPPLVIITASALSLWAKTIKNNFIPVIVSVVILVILIIRSWSEVRLRFQITPPTIAPVLYVLENFDPNNTTLITTFTYRQFQYYAPEFHNYYGAENAPTEIKTSFVIIDYEGLRTHIPYLKKYKIEYSKEFSEPRLYFSRLTTTNLYILKNKNIEND